MIDRVANRWQLTLLCTFMIALLSVLLNAGCSSLTMFPGKKLTTDQQSAHPFQADPQVPARIAVFWKEDVLSNPHGKPVRGFSGRVYFYDLQDRLMQVDGELIVYGFDDSSSERSREADRKYIFPADKFRDHYHPSELGHAYAVWLPWQPYDDPRKLISLVPMFRTANHKVIQGSTNRLSLRGNAPAESQQVQDSTSSRSTNLYYSQSESPPPSSTQSDQRPRVDAIPIPPSLATKINKIPTHTPANRMPPANLNLASYDSPESNPHGHQFNRVQIDKSVSRIPDANPDASSDQSTRKTNSAETNRPAFLGLNQPPSIQQPPLGPAAIPHATSATPRTAPVFGKPGEFR